jgi:Sensors of blue-light using FAD
MPTPMPLLQLTYASRPFGFSEASLAGILLDARRCNIRDDITGALICRDDLFVQMLEGPEHAVDTCFRRILRDDRHIGVVPLTRRHIPGSGRLFPRWAMHDDPARSWIWTRAEVAKGAVDRATEAEIISIFMRLAYEMEEQAG